MPVRKPTEPAKPFLRWVGGKRQLVPRLLSLLPDDVADRKYFEPFLGAGSLFFGLRPRSAVLGDANSELINCYSVIRRRPDLVARYVAQHTSAHNSQYYYRTRRSYNEGGSETVQAARFIYLNATCFNGVFRVNRAGEFNVPIGSRRPPRFPTRLEFRRIASALRGVKLRNAFYYELMTEADADAFVYLDPPYPPLTETANFTHYTLDRFTKNDQETLATHFDALSRSGAKILMTNADTAAIRHRYRRYRITPLEVTRWVSCKGERYSVGEVAITNYPRG